MNLPVSHYNLHILDTKSMRMKQIHNCTYENMILIDENLPALENSLGRRLGRIQAFEILYAAVRKELIIEKPPQRNDLRRSIRFCLKQREFNEIWNSN